MVFDSDVYSHNAFNGYMMFPMKLAVPWIQSQKPLTLPYGPRTRSSITPALWLTAYNLPVYA